MDIITRKYATLTVTGTTAIRRPITKRSVQDFAVGADWTPASGDVKIAIDGASPVNVTNLPTAVASGNGAFWEFILTAAELTCKQAVVIVADAATKAVEDTGFVVETFGNASAMYQADLSAVITAADIAAAVRTNLTTELGRIDEAVSAADDATLSAIASLSSAISALNNLSQAGVRTAVGLGSANLDTQLAALASYVDTEVAAIKAKTDLLTFGTGNALAANVKRVNDVALTGNGTTTPWGP